MPKKEFLHGINVNLFIKKKQKARSKTWFSEKNIFENSKIFPAPCLQPVNLKVSLKLFVINMSYYFTRILLMTNNIFT